MARLLVANLHGETELALAARGDPADAVDRLPERVLRTISAIGTLLRFASDDADSLWTPRPIASSRLGRGPGPRPRLIAGRLDEIRADFDDVLAWCETPAIARLRRRLLGADSSTDDAWRATLIASDRRTWIERTSAAGLSLPGTRVVESVTEITAHVAAGGATLSRSNAWVVKAPFSAAGRDRVHGRGRPGTKESAALERLLRDQGALVFEPWCERIDDLGLLSPGPGTDDTALHAQIIDSGGRFAGIRLAPIGLAHEEHARLLAAASIAVDLIGSRPDATRNPTARVDTKRPGPDFRPPAGEPHAGDTVEAPEGECDRPGASSSITALFGIDAWHYRHPNGAVTLHAAGECNPRWTIGRVARCVARHMPLGISGGELHLGVMPPSGRSIPLLDVGAEGDPGAWWTPARRSHDG